MSCRVSGLVKRHGNTLVKYYMNACRPSSLSFLPVIIIIIFILPVVIHHSHYHFRCRFTNFHWCAYISKSYHLSKIHVPLQLPGSVHVGEGCPVTISKSRPCCWRLSHRNYGEVVMFVKVASQQLPKGVRVCEGCPTAITGECSCCWRLSHCNYGGAFTFKKVVPLQCPEGVGWWRLSHCNY